ncbi:MAG: hypothetical protein LBC86_10330 [Oscillospiraceae bacterium]|jgi:hypothetical protein|nr:hypothetical protein [Oscillospiraceae bacterium]
MRKVEVALNENKIKSEGKYSLEAIYNALDESFIEYASMQKQQQADGTIIYFAPKMIDENHYAKIWLAIDACAEEQWLVENALKYLYGDTYESDNPDDYSIEDILEEFEIGKSVY